MSGTRWGLIAIALGFAHVAHAQDATRIPIAVEPDASACITTSSLRARVGQWRVQASSAAQQLRVRVDASATPLRFELLRGDDVVASRAFDVLPERCADRLAAVALVIAVSLEHAGATHSEEPEPAESASAGTEASSATAATNATAASTAEPAPKPEAAPAAETDAEDEPPARDADDDEDDAADEAPSGPPVPIDVQVHGGAGVLIGTLPNPVALFDAGLALRLRALRFGLSGLVTTESASLLGGGTARAQLIGGRARACLGSQAGAFDLEGCAGVALGVVSAEGEDLASSTGTVHLVWLAPHARLSARFPANSILSVRLAVDGLVQAVRPELRVTAGSGRAGARDTASVLAITSALELVLEL